jgi:hypothetical protein
MIGQIGLAVMFEEHETLSLWPQFWFSQLRVHLNLFNLMWVNVHIGVTFLWKLK